MAVLEVEDMETGKRMLIEDSLVPGAKDWKNGQDTEVDWDALKKAEVVPIEDGLNVDVVANPQENKDNTVEYIGNSRRGRGDNAAGGGRNVLQGLLAGGADEAEAWFRSHIWDPKGLGLSYDDYLKNARESYKGYSAEHPGRAVAMQIGGALLPSLLTLGAAAPATAASTASMVGRGAAAGLGMGALQGYLSGEGENRGETAMFNAGLGALLGGATPALIKGGQGIAKGISEIKKGTGANVARSEAGQKMINLVSGANDNYIDNTMYLGMGAMKGEEGIQKAAKDITFLRKQAQKAEKQGYNPNVVDGYSDLTQSLKTPEMLAADEAYANFAAAVPEGTNSGMAMDVFFKKHPLAYEKYMKYGERMPDVKPNSFEGMRDVNNVLRKQMKKAQASQNFSVADDLEDAIADLSMIRENTTPGIKEIDRMWSAARNKQDVVDDIFFDNVKKIANPKEMLSPEISMTGAARTLFPARARGVARELLETGTVAPAGTGTTNQIIQKAFSPIENVGTKGFKLGPLNIPGFKVGPVTTPRAGQALMLDYGLANENIE